MNHPHSTCDGVPHCGVLLRDANAMHNAPRCIGTKPRSPNVLASSLPSHLIRSPFSNPEKMEFSLPAVHPPPLGFCVSASTCRILPRCLPYRPHMSLQRCYLVLVMCLTMGQSASSHLPQCEGKIGAIIPRRVKSVPALLFSVSHLPLSSCDRWIFLLCLLPLNSNCPCLARIFVTCRAEKESW